MIIFLSFVLPGCLGLTGTKITVHVPDGPSIQYVTDESKQIDGFNISRTKDGNWTVSLKKSTSEANKDMAILFTEVMKKFPNIPLK